MDILTRLLLFLAKGRPLKSVPFHLKNKFSMGGRIRINIAYADNSKKVATRYTSARIQQTLKMIEQREVGEYGEVDRCLYKALERHSIFQQQVAIIGSAEQGFGPWYECVCLSWQGIPTTIEYNQVIYEDDRLKAFTPGNIAKDRTFDAAISISSFEHDGLGRYGDPIDPDGDLKAMKKMKAVLKAGGKMFLAVPLGQDKVCFNIHRIYGRIRLPLLLEGWSIVDSVGYDEALLDRDTGMGWYPKDASGAYLHPEYPEYSPVLVLRND